MASLKRKNRNKSKQTAPIDITILLPKIVTVVFLFALFILLPLVFNDHYYDIGPFKYKLFFIIFLAYECIMGILMIPYFFVRIKNGEYKGKNIKDFFKTISVVDWFVVAYLVATTISFFCSEFHSLKFFSSEITDNMAWIGFNGWLMGYRTQLILFIAYFFVSRFFVKEINYDAVKILLAAVGLVYLFAVLHRIDMDPLGFYVGLEPKHKLEFLTTIGQSSWYSAFMAAIFPMGLCLYTKAEKTVDKVFYILFMIVGFMSLVSQNSDSAYMAIAAVFVTMFMFAFENNDAMKRYLEIVLIFLLSARVMGILMISKTDEYVMERIDTLSRFVMLNNVTWIIILFVGALYGILIYDSKNAIKNNTSEKININKIQVVRFVVLGLSVAGVITAIALVVMTTKGMIPALANEESAFRGYFVFDGSWGNNRGRTWMFAKDIYMDYKPLYKLFGCGPDCFGYYAYKNMAELASDYWGNETIENAHNELYNMLINGGIIGMITYGGMFVSSIVSFIRNRNKSPYIYGAAVCVISYMAHNVFCYQTCCNTPFLIAIIGVAVAINRMKYEKV